MENRTPIRIKRKGVFNDDCLRQRVLAQDEFSAHVNKVSKHVELTPSRTPKKSETRTPLQSLKNRSDLHKVCDSDGSLRTPNRCKLKASDSFNEIGKIRVAVRVRPLTSKELSTGSGYSFDVNDREVIVKNGTTCDLTVGAATTYVYNNVFWSSRDDCHIYSDQAAVFKEMAVPLLDAALEGYNACLFAYGQTGSGKTYSMMGSCLDVGIIPRFCEELLGRRSLAKSPLKIDLSYFEIYNEKIHDLLIDNSVDVKASLRVREHPVTGPYVEGLSSRRVETLMDLNTLLDLGNSRRVTCATTHNEQSSRSHALLEIILSSGEEAAPIRSKISLVDLAGSERVSYSMTGGDRFREGLSINKSLLTLGKVIASLSDPKKGSFVPYRESVLTWLLKESLGGNSHTAMLATVSPSPAALEETLATLRYACQARHIVNRVATNEDPQLKVIRDLQKEVERLKSLQEEYVNNKSLQKIENTRFLIPNSKMSADNSDELKKLEMRQKDAEEKLQMELDRLKTNLIVAEKRRDELESQKFAFYDQIKKANASLYETDFYENLQDILNESVDEKNGETKECFDSNEAFMHLENISKSIEALYSKCSSKSGNLILRRALPALNVMKKSHEELSEILCINSMTNL